MTWAGWVQVLLAEQEGPERWSRERRRAEEQWARIWCPPDCIRVRQRLVSVERIKRRQWKAERVAA